MCPPRHFAVRYEINPWMDAKAWARGASIFSQMAARQWMNFHDVLVALGVTLAYVKPRPDLPDLVFTANAAIVLDRTALLSRFRHPERQREQPVFAAAFSALKARGQIEAIVDTPENIAFEGAGDCMWDAFRGHFWMGFGPRSQLAANAVVRDVFAVECEPLELADPRFYHLDTAFCPLPSGDVMYYPEAFTPAARDKIAERLTPQQRIELDHQDATVFAANAVAFDHSIVLSSCSQHLRRILEERGIAVATAPLDAFRLGGGSAYCLTLRLDHRGEATTAVAIPREQTSSRA